MSENSTNRVELLAPAGNYESFLGAVHAGADAVYLGGARFGARAYADNFTEEEICRAIRYAHLFGRRVYLTVNTLIKDSEFEEIVPYIRPFYEAGLDGVIIQDIGAFLKIREAFPGLKLHVSTQMTVTGSHAANMLKDMGAVRIVPARELSLEEIRTMKEETGLELETFIHGAMCYCYSGQCLFSSILGGRSGNRGRCAQPCRLPYQVTDNGRENGAKISKDKKRAPKDEYPLSLKDMCSIMFLPQLIESGIDSFKIEGRMKKPEYAAGVTAVYRKYIDLYYNVGAKAYKVERADLDKLASLYIRSGIQDGYYFKHNGADMITLSSPAYNGSDDILLEKIRKQYIDAFMKRDIHMFASFETGKTAQLALTCGNHTVTVSGDIVQEAAKQPITAENIKTSLLKLGNTPFSCNEKDMEIMLSENAFYSLKALNELRRKGTECLENAINDAFVENERQNVCKIQSDTYVCANKRDGVDFEQQISDVAEESGKNEAASGVMKNVHVLVRSAAQLKALSESEIVPGILYLDTEFDGLSVETVHSIKNKVPYKGNTAVYIALPYIVRKKDIPYLESLLPLIHEADGVLVRNMETYGWLKKMGYAGKINTDAGVYTFNKSALQFWKEKSDICCLPYELNKKELRKLYHGVSAVEQIVYGRIPLMITANCVAKTTSKCRKGALNAGNPLYLTDRYQKKFAVCTNCEQCYNIIYNALPLSLHDKVLKGEMQTLMRMQFSVENGEETRRVLHFWKSVLCGVQTQIPYEEYTLGHEKRGVE